MAVRDADEADVGMSSSQPCSGDCLGGWRGLQAQQALALGPVAGGGQQGEHRLPDVRGEGGQGSDGEVASHGRGLSCSGFPMSRGVLTMLVGCW